jgi:hypothetical protein
MIREYLFAFVSIKKQEKKFIYVNHTHTDRIKEGEREINSSTYFVVYFKI